MEVKVTRKVARRCMNDVSDWARLRCVGSQRTLKLGRSVSIGSE